ncbi:MULTISPECIES: hypothetical protein [unclassified Wenzhouxiangella]|uniref:hypothetical protein n=1 Tax=unclassified Wenzhouxiangella TaxID=2613841 RepID=UPI000E328E36|nr:MULTISPECIES: hypothetical protein [unclassified Wenzhouxiangella]RFF27568.1 hypothetical protein DZK25_07735 [Wenzhouxiangella sp. 15181]RFP69570.1 hypothetical protein DZK26_02910 [Wenzhouxiangella sp. 15190]
MKAAISTSQLLAALLLLALTGAASGETCEDAYCIDWWSIDSGGEMFSQSGDGHWQLSGTVGQWDATPARELSGGEWRLTGGLWGLTLEELADRLFDDRFEPAP